MCDREYDDTRLDSGFVQYYGVGRRGVSHEHHVYSAMGHGIGAFLDSMMR